MAKLFRVVPRNRVGRLSECLTRHRHLFIVCSPNSEKGEERSLEARESSGAPGDRSVVEVVVDFKPTGLRAGRARSLVCIVLSFHPIFELTSRKLFHWQTTPCRKGGGRPLFRPVNRQTEEATDLAGKLISRTSLLLALPSVDSPAALVGTVMHR